MIEAFGTWNLCPLGRLRQKKNNMAPDIFLKIEVEKKEHKHPGFEMFNWDALNYSIAGLWVSLEDISGF